MNFINFSYLIIIFLTSLPFQLFSSWFFYNSYYSFKINIFIVFSSDKNTILHFSIVVVSLTNSVKRFFIVSIITISIIIRLKSFRLFSILYLTKSSLPYSQFRLKDSSLFQLSKFSITISIITRLKSFQLFSILYLAKFKINYQNSQL